MVSHRAVALKIKDNMLHRSVIYFKKYVLKNFEKYKYTVNAFHSCLYLLFQIYKEKFFLKWTEIKFHS
jgi:hypothetical protein